MTDTINATQCAELLFCDTVTIEALARKGELPGLKFGRGWVFFRADLLVYLAEQARKSAEQRRLQLTSNTPRTPLVIQSGRRRRVPPPLPSL